MYSRQFVISFVLFVLAINACKSRNTHIVPARFPLTITFKEGDDGQIINSLQISKYRNHYSAIEIETDNFSEHQVRGL
jgi:hypothetical protein